MTVSAAKNKTELKKRMLRFFSEESSRKDVLIELKPLLEKGEVLAFGGVVRDIALYGGKAFSSDLDLIYTGDKIFFKNTLKNKAQKNKFGGYRLKTGEWDTDIWHIEDTWAFAHKKACYNNELSLLNTTITNWDAILYSINKNRILCKKNYFKDLSSGYLDLVLEENPNTFGAMIRILRCLILKDASEFSPSIIKFLNRNFQKYSIDQILNQESKSYKETCITMENCFYIKKVIKANADSFLPAIFEKNSESIETFTRKI